jgi:large subunit ribosomal protein L35
MPPHLGVAFSLSDEEVQMHRSEPSWSRRWRRRTFAAGSGCAPTALTGGAAADYMARFRGVRPVWAAETSPNDLEEIEMPKMKTKSGAKKRFKVTATGRIKVQQAGKRHGMIKRSNKFIRNARGTTVLSAPDEKIVKQFLPYA